VVQLRLCKVNMLEARVLKKDMIVCMEIYFSSSKQVHFDALDSQFKVNLLYISLRFQILKINMLVSIQNAFFH
jgi:hypothetical protein